MTNGASGSRFRFRRPESVLVLVAVVAGPVLLLERRTPPGLWQSVTGSLRWGETAAAAAARELAEETGIEAAGRIEDLGSGARFRILAAWRHRFAPGVVDNDEHWFRLWLDRPVAVRLAPREHGRFAWVSPTQAAARVFSWSNRAAIERYLARD
ncbi:MAG TPA: dihydroneopterin triphosphate diphosphatase [Gammaproteobacteria bacterium]|nr:dihydroneopterin triphosphate diphosphatase [Gammaproteobacteria bacterium]